MSIAALLTISNIWKQPKYPSINEWIKQLWDIYTLEFYSAIKKKILPCITAWMVDLENIMLNETNQSEKDKCTMISLTCESNEQTELTSKTETDSQMESR